ncbi:transposable element Tcb2 transposase [Trichonephila clavipes]|uniref:Transposable element Tcb2 transposase n=1 Tax=Trichonephila clavipes TaxID=2585209 RepID=A0A8X6VM31_TRICX|nr:transposable element Tcb2 transposase [Trichonephila clavipes]
MSDISRQTVSKKLWKQFQNDGTVVRRPGQGRKRMTTASEDRSGSVTGQIYRDEVLDPYARLFRGAYGRDFYLWMIMLVHIEQTSLMNSESEDIKLPWPANSPDLNPMKLMGYLGRAIFEM